MKTSDVAIIGGGIVGLATAYELLQFRPQTRVFIFEKEPDLATHQTGHNSGVLHSGIYYRPGSLKAINCREGKKAMEAFCAVENIPYEICGKVIVATDESELPALQQIFERGQANGVTCSMIGPDRLKELEPHAAGIKAIHVPEAGIIDFKHVSHRLAERIREKNGQILTHARVERLINGSKSTTVVATSEEVESRVVVNCAGLHSDRVTALSGQNPGIKIIPFRGEYYELKPNSRHLCKNLIYPVPDPKFPFLGVHFTRMISGHVECGPNAVLAFAREGYRKTDINIYDLLDTLTFPGFRRLAIQYWRTGLEEIWRSLSKAAFVHALQKLIPGITESDLIPAPAGVRAQAVSPDGKMVDDFYIQETENVINVGNAPSPAATASLNIGKLITEKIRTHLD